jgi:hypothetical protein
LNHLDLSQGKVQTSGMKEKTAHSVYLPTELLAALKQFAKEQRRSVNFVITEILTEWHSKLHGGQK